MALVSYNWGREKKKKKKKKKACTSTEARSRRFSLAFRRFGSAGWRFGSVGWPVDVSPSVLREREREILLCTCTLYVCENAFI